ncbi:MAG: malate synthase G, partial [Pseudomonadota bacterium]
MSATTAVAGLTVDTELLTFINDEVLAPLNIEPAPYWSGFARVVDTYSPRSAALLQKRDQLQAQLDEFHRTHPGAPDGAVYESFLREIGYLVPEGEPFSVDTANVDPEIATTAGPQLVVPVTNARYVLNAANARWGSLYDALYGTDAVPETNGAEKAGGYNPVRGGKVIEQARAFLDSAVPLHNVSWTDARGLSIADGALIVALDGDVTTGLAEPDTFAGYIGAVSAPTSVLLRHNGLHIEIRIDAEGQIGSKDPAHINDVWLESALSTIVDFEDSVAVVDAQDKVAAYRNWLGLMSGALTASFQKGNQTVERTLNPDVAYTKPDGTQAILTGRSLLLVRNNGGLMSSDAIRDAAGTPVPEGIMDAIITSTIALYDLRAMGTNGVRNSRAGSVYIVRPKMHGPDEVAFTDQLFGAVEDMLGLERHTLKMGIMDEERRTTVNLKECIRAAKHRVAFINTGFLDRTGDEMHTSM